MTEIELELLVELHMSGDRQGPGSNETTLQALQLTGLDLTKPLKVADIGCGTGASTLVLAKHLEGQITAVDIFPEVLAKLEQRAAEQGLQDKITTLQCSMDALPFSANGFDLIWSEGAVYNMGFENGIRAWRKFLKPEGLLVVSESVWLTTERPQPIEDFWNTAYPEIDTVANKIKVLEQNGYLPLAHFVLPENCWTDKYYTPLEARIPKFLQKHPDDEVAKQVVEEHYEEIKMYQEYKQYYSYGCFIAKKLADE
ncbi:class I SAM-dependent methyltransferase [Pontibacter sp. KCTC 32443]|uniref:class I SAM-dependent methyltransferase n=1 Tax=Pontibacter TaxID=323449 RepID=UPI00164DE580|nr:MULTISPECIES: class I SAM-dependent methyltransferase [Pontibacter]MBC5773752.1 class I SAM-dependent methyltransferase [Pontibacter sp. KCTC 32443]